jgi:hypothetical protein
MLLVSVKVISPEEAHGHQVEMPVPYFSVENLATLNLANK